MSKKKIYNFIVPHGTYPFDVMVSIGETDEQLFSKLKSKLPSQYHDSILEYAAYNTIGYGRFAMFPTGASLIRIKEKPKTARYQGFLAHEIFHAVEFLFERIGLKHDSDISGEAWAYQIQYLTEKIYERI